MEPGRSLEGLAFTQGDEEPVESFERGETLFSLGFHKAAGLITVCPGQGWNRKANRLL